MKQELTVIRAGTTQRLERLLDFALADLSVEELSAQDLTQARDRHILFAVGMDAYGPDASFYTLVRYLRQEPDCLEGSVAGLVVDGGGELYTKQAAQTLVMAANMAGCAFPGKPLVEGTGSLYNQHILAQRMHLNWETTYFHRVRDLARRVADFVPPTFPHPRILMLHASEHRHSNTVWMGRQVMNRLSAPISYREVSLHNGTIQDCRGCSYKACRHFAQHNTCFYGGVISQEVLPAIAECSAMLFLCPNYNDAVSANITALFNRLTNLLHQHELYDKYLFGIVVSGYSGSDLVAQQLMGAMCLNKTVMLPPRFCLMQTANDPGSARTMEGIDDRLTQFVARMESVLCRRPNKTVI